MSRTASWVREGLDDVVVVGASTARSSPPVVPVVRSADVSTLLIRARAFDCCSIEAPIWGVGVRGWLW
ncbi:hypothetical protein [Streptomyces sp. NPDC050535]|uniref:hypothetical protein n=1 Tax=Streptomyces sp. NPDC050535 TaxID=3365626 RepID=UPI0037B08195